MGTPWWFAPLMTCVGVVIGGVVSTINVWLTQRLSRRQTVRNEKKEAYCQILGILGQMRLAVDDIMRVGPTSDAAVAASDRLRDLRQELYRTAPCAVMILNVSATRAYEAFRWVAEPALQLSPATIERWKREGEAIENATNELVAAGRAELGF
jgi:hypothetical protein